MDKTLNISAHNLAKEIFIISKTLDSDIQDLVNFSDYIFSFNKAEFEDIKSLLEYIYTIPSNTASAERGFSNLKYLKNHLRSTQSTDRIESILLLYSEVGITEQIINHEGEIRNIL